MAKGHDYGLVTQEVVNGRNQTIGNGYKLKSAQELTKATVLDAMAILLKANPGFDKLSPTVAAQKIKEQLKKMGFTGTLNTSGGAIGDSHGNRFQISHGKYKGSGILTVNEKK